MCWETFVFREIFLYTSLGTIMLTNIRFHGHLCSGKFFFTLVKEDWCSQTFVSTGICVQGHMLSFHMWYQNLYKYYNGNACPRWHMGLRHRWAGHTFLNIKCATGILIPVLLPHENPAVILYQCRATCWIKKGLIGPVLQGRYLILPSNRKPRASFTSCKITTNISCIASDS